MEENISKLTQTKENRRDFMRQTLLSVHMVLGICVELLILSYCRNLLCAQRGLSTLCGFPFMLLNFINRI